MIFPLEGDMERFDTSSCVDAGCAVSVSSA